MSVSDPVLKRLKQAVLQLRLSESKVDDRHELLQPLCESLEDIFRKGLKQPTSVLRLTKRDYWHMFEALPQIFEQSFQKKGTVHPLFQMCLSEVLHNKRGLVDQGRGRLMIRQLLQKGMIAWPIEALVKTLCVSDQFYDDLYSVVGNEILAEILLSLLRELAQVKFDLCLKNCAFLDDTWLLPAYEEYEFVPCKSLGLSLITVEEHQLVDALIPGSVAAENSIVEPGDILDELVGVPLKANLVRLKDIMHKNSGLPVRCSFIKVTQVDGSFYPPIVHMLRKINRYSILRPTRKAAGGRPQEHCPTDNNELPPHARLGEDYPDDVPAQNPAMNPSYTVSYVGEIAIGRDGGVHQIEVGIEKTLKVNNDPSKFIRVQLELGEKDVTVTDVATGNILFQHAYPRISSCGRRIDCTRFFAYIAGESTCTISTNFVCHVFEASTDFESKTILCSVAQGFERTHWAL